MSEKASCITRDFQNCQLRFSFLSHARTKYFFHNISICSFWNTNDLTLQSFIIIISKRTSKNTLLWIAFSAQKSMAKSQLLRLWDRQDYLRSGIAYRVSLVASSHFITLEIEKYSHMIASKGHLANSLSQMTMRVK